MDYDIDEIVYGDIVDTELDDSQVNFLYWWYYELQYISQCFQPMRKHKDIYKKLYVSIDISKYRKDNYVKTYVPCGMRCYRQNSHRMA